MTSRTDMVFVRRNDQGRIAEVALCPQEGFEPCLALSEPELPGLTEKLTGQLNLLASTDLSLIRVLEDLIDLLIAKDMIRFTDLPDMAQRKLLDRRSLRAEMQALDLLGEDFDEVL